MDLGRVVRLEYSNARNVHEDVPGRDCDLSLLPVLPYILSQAEDINIFKLQIR